MADDFAERLDQTLASVQQEIERDELSEQEAERQRRGEAQTKDEWRARASGVATQYQRNVLEPLFKVLSNHKDFLGGTTDSRLPEDSTGARIGYLFGDVEVVVSVELETDAGNLMFCAFVLQDRSVIHRATERFSLDEFDESHARDWAEAQLTECAAVAKRVSRYKPVIVTYEKNA